MGRHWWAKKWWGVKESSRESSIAPEDIIVADEWTRRRGSHLDPKQTEIKNRVEKVTGDKPPIEMD